MSLSAAERKRRSRAEAKKAQARFGGRVLQVPMYQATIDALERLCVAHGFTGKQRLAECLTHIVHQEDEKQDVVTSHKNEVSK